MNDSDRVLLADCLAETVSALSGGDLDHDGFITVRDLWLLVRMIEGGN